VASTGEDKKINRLGDTGWDLDEAFQAQSQREYTVIEEFTDLVEPYSIDELFADFTGSMHLFGNDPVDLAKQIQDKIYNETGVYARAGIGENKIISKLCCDMIAKKAEGGIKIIHMLMK
jgi:nucleotidyltransferase/DNA polymerase involved in DNA repair